MQRIQVNEKHLSFDGDIHCAKELIESLREVYKGSDMPKVLNDFVFNIELSIDLTEGANND